MITLDLAEYVVGQMTSRLPPDARHHAKRTVVDWFAAVAPGGVLPPARAIADALRGEGDTGQAVVYPSGPEMSLRGAALVNATAAHTVEFDDIFRDAIYHPGCIVVAAGLATCQARGLSGERFVRSVVAGIEASTRIGVVINPAHYRNWHTTGTVGTFGAAATVGAALGLDAMQLAHALATAATWAAGLRKAFASDAMSKPLHAGHAADAGTLAALGAAHGVTGVLDILEAPGGFGDTVSEDCDWSRATEGLGSVYNVGRLTIKNHGCCGHTFAAIDAALALRRNDAVAPDQIEAVDIATYGSALEVAGNLNPQTPFEAKFSIPFVVATALLHGKVRLDAFTPERVRNAKIRALMRRVCVRRDDALDALFPTQRAARLRLRMKDGSVLEHYQSTRRGDPDDPLTDQELEDKYRELVGPVAGEEATEALLRKIWILESVDPLDLRLGAGG